MINLTNIINKAKYLIINSKYIFNPIDSLFGKKMVQISPFLWATMVYNFIFYNFIFYLLLILCVFFISDLNSSYLFIHILLLISFFILCVYIFNLFIRKTKYELLVYKGAISKIIMINFSMLFLYFLGMTVSHVIFKHQVDAKYTEKQNIKLTEFNSKFEKLLSNQDVALNENEKKKSLEERFKIIDQKILQSETSIKQKYLDAKMIFFNEYNFLFFKNNSSFKNKELEVIKKVREIEKIKRSFLYDYPIFEKDIILFIYIILLMSIISNIFNLNFFKCLLIVGSILLPSILFVEYFPKLSIGASLIFLFVYFLLVNKYLPEIIYYTLFGCSLYVYLDKDINRVYLWEYLVGITIVTVLFYYAIVKKKLLSPQ